MYKIGIDLGGTNISVGVVNEKYEVVGRGVVKTKLPRSAAEIFDDMKAAADEAVKKAGITYDNIESVGVGAPGSINKSNGYIEFSNNFGFNKVPAKEMLEERFGKPVYIDNDANCAALGEAIAGAGNGVKSFVAITLGTGVGSGIIVDGKLVNGVNGAAGEMGHMVIVVNGEQCNCGRKGCWERYASATALISQTKAAMLEDKDSIMWELVGGDINKVGGRTAFDAWRRGDKTATRVVNDYIYYVAVGVTNIVNTFQPDVVCIGGGISNEGDNLIKPVAEHVARERYSVHAEIQTKIMKAQLGNDAGIIGSALLTE
ncbi:MAG: ROK family protein [Clostridiales bacterium]|nr:ROK family protein [Clostridiales bacterium]